MHKKNFTLLNSFLIALILFTPLITIPSEKDEEKSILIPLQFSDLSNLLQLRLVSKDFSEIFEKHYCTPDVIATIITETGNKSSFFHDIQNIDTSFFKKLSPLLWNNKSTVGSVCATRYLIRQAPKLLLIFKASDFFLAPFYCMEVWQIAALFHKTILTSPKLPYLFTPDKFLNKETYMGEIARLVKEKQKKDIPLNYTNSNT